MLRHLLRGQSIEVEDSGSVFNARPQSMARKARPQMQGLSRVERGRALPGGHCGAHVSEVPGARLQQGSRCALCGRKPQGSVFRDRGFRVGSAMSWLCDLGQDIQMCPSFSLLNCKMQEWHSLWRAAGKAKRGCGNKCPAWGWHTVGLSGFWFPSSTQC